MPRYLVIPLKLGDIFDEECNEALVLAPTETQARKHIEHVISKKFKRWIIRPIETNFNYSRR